MTEISSKLASQVLEKAFTNSQAEGGAAGANPETSPFSEMLQDTMTNMDLSDILGTKDNLILPKGQAEAISAEGIPFDSKEGFDRFEVNGGDKLLNMLGDFNQQQMHMDNLVNDVLYGNKKFSNQELLAIQAHVFHVAQMTELTVKSVELAVSSFKGVMNTQIQ